MPPNIFTLQSSDIETSDNGAETFANDVKSGLSAGRKYIPAEYHYDDEGSRLFNLITELPEYYLTRCEIDALDRNKGRIADSLDDDAVNLIEFGPGDGSKTRALIEHFLQCGLKVRYVAVDISRGALEQLAEDYHECFPDLPVDCLEADYSTSLKWLRERYRERNVALFLGSSIGNFMPADARGFLRNLRNDLNQGDMLITGFDLVKDPELIHRAYNDSEEVTAAFNLNVLERINRELDADFDVSKFRYEARYNNGGRVMESFLHSLEDHEVEIGALQKTFRFRRGESIHTEDSHKFRESDIEDLAVRSGFRVREHLYDSKKYFADSVWEVHDD